MKNRELLVWLITAFICAALVFFIYGEGRVKAYSGIFAMMSLYLCFKLLVAGDSGGSKVVDGKGKEARLNQSGEFTNEDIRERAAKAIIKAAKNAGKISLMMSYRFMLRIEEGIKVPPIFGLKGIDFDKILVIAKPRAGRDYYELYMEGCGTAQGRRRDFKVLAKVIECDGSLYLDEIISEIPKDRLQDIKAAAAV